MFLYKLIYLRGNVSRRYMARKSYFKLKIAYYFLELIDKIENKKKWFGK